jgi:hypothetical protein
MSRRTLVIGAVLAAVVAVPAVALAVNAPSDGFLEALSGPAGDFAEGPYEWMNDMHGNMWDDSDGSFPGGILPDDASWMNEMHSYMWDNTDGALPGGVSPDGASWMNDMHSQMWSDLDETAIGTGSGGFGMPGGRSAVGAVGPR